jgi:hypothetical protein
MFWKRKEGELPSPKEIPGLVKKYLESHTKIDPALLEVLRAVIRKNPQGEKRYDIRVYDPAQEQVRKVTIKDYTSLDEAPTLILYEGWYDEQSKQVELQEKTKFIYDVPLLSQVEIQKRIEALTTPGSSVFFYQARGQGLGGPLGRGVAIVELNPNGVNGKKHKKYAIYPANIDGTEIVDKGPMIFDSDKAKDVAGWVMQAHRKREY